MRKSITTSIVIALAALSTTVQAESCNVKDATITATGNRGAHFDVNGGMRHAGLTVLYPEKAQTKFVGNKRLPDTFKGGYLVSFKGERTDNTMCQPVGKVVVTKK